MNDFTVPVNLTPRALCLTFEYKKLIVPLKQFLLKY